MHPRRGNRASRVLAFLAAFVLPSVVVLIFLLRLPGWEREIGQIAEAKERIAAQNEIFKTLLQMVGGSLLITGFYFTWKTIEVNQQGQITDRFNKAIDHLGETNLAVRLGGIYALARIALDSERDAPTVVEVLSAVVREATKDPALSKPTADVICILTLLGTKAWAKGSRVDLSGCNLQRLELNDADLQGWVFMDANLSDANLQRSRLDGASFVGADATNASLRACSLRGADLSAANLEGATLRNVKAQGAHLFGTRLAHCSLFGADFEGSTGATKPDFDAAFFDETTVLPEFKKEFDEPA